MACGVTPPCHGALIAFRCEEEFRPFGWEEFFFSESNLQALI
jgi:hypothetical protein